MPPQGMSAEEIVKKHGLRSVGEMADLFETLLSGSPDTFHYDSFRLELQAWHDQIAAAACADEREQAARRIEYHLRHGNPVSDQCGAYSFAMKIVREADRPVEPSEGEGT